MSQRTRYPHCFEFSNRRRVVSFYKDCPDLVEWINEMIGENTSQNRLWVWNSKVRNGIAVYRVFFKDPMHLATIKLAFHSEGKTFSKS